MILDRQGTGFRLDCFGFGLTSIGFGLDYCRIQLLLVFGGALEGLELGVRHRAIQDSRTLVPKPKTVEP